MNNQQSFKHRLILALIPIACWVMRLLFMTIKVEVIDPHGVSPYLRKEERFIYAFWHNQQLVAAYFFRNYNICVLASRSKDGDYISKVLNHFGFGTVRSSSSNGKVNALRGLARELKKGYHTAITPDGPRGPIYKAQPGAVFLAALAGVRIIPLASAVKDVWYLKRTWDKFEIPKPFSKAIFVFGEPIEVPRHLDDQLSEYYLKKTEESMIQCRNQALEKVKY